jgi:HK97 family phage major capsid protein
MEVHVSRDLASLRQARATAYQRMSDLQARADNDNRSLTAEEQTTFDAAATEIEGIDARIRTAERMQALRASTALSSMDSEAAANDLPADAPARGAAPQARQPVESGVMFAQTVRALVIGRGDTTAAAAWASSTWGERYDVTAALQANDASAGGFLVPERFSSEVIELLRPKTVVRRNSRVVPLVGGNDTMPTVESGSAAYYIGEGSDITTSEPGFGQLKFVEREIAALVPISNKLLRHGAVNVDVMVRDDITLGFAQSEDLAFLRSNGVGPAPKGLRYLAAAANVIPANGTVNLANIEKDARKAINALILSDIPMTNVRWVMSPSDFGYLQDLRDGNGNLVFPGLNLPVPMWKGFPVEQTNNVPINLGGASNESEVYLVDFGETVVADSFQVRIDTSESASYKVAGSLVSAYSRNQTLIRAVAAHDFGIRRAKAVAILTGVLWGRS